MNSSDYKAVGHGGNVYCIECLPNSADLQSDDVDPIFANTEWDVYPVCCICSRIHDYVVLLEPENGYLQSNHWEQQREFGGAG